MIYTTQQLNELGYTWGIGMLAVSQDLAKVIMTIDNLTSTAYVLDTDNDTEYAIDSISELDNNNIIGFELDYISEDNLNIIKKLNKVLTK